MVGIERVGKPTIRFVAVSETTSHLWAMAAFGVLMGVVQFGVIAWIVSLAR